ncbi:amidohydrolase family protein [uncultured Fusobacterium sp.]|uniref:amidohydrolase family protein n=1 Tax=uncultured Fusobacterium sp. TaxID=159267 RepID=UPI0025F960CD|nr:amidohydrolase family protein [uncultured Fusobacterium sp.]
MKIVINNGLVIDPKNSINDYLNLEITNGKISKISKDKLVGDYEIDATNLCVTPGFIDIHMHEDIMKDGKIQIDIFERMLKMGVTTAIGGNCGIGPNNIGEYLKEYEKNPLINFKMLLPHKILRDYIGAEDRYTSLSSDEIEKMYRYGEKIIKENNLLGISFGIEYIPGINREELVNLAKLGENKIIAVHLRKDGDDIIESCEEFFEIAKYINSHFQISHIGSMAGYGQMRKFLNYIQNKIDNGLDIGCDCYPYTAFSTHIGSAVFDDGYIESHGGDYSRLEVLDGKYKGQRCTKEIFNYLRKNSPDTLVAGHLMVDEDIKIAFQDKNVVVASDGLLSESGNGHPRAVGTFPKFLRKYVLDDKIMSLSEGVAKITNQPADFYGLKAGTLSIGANGDITIFSLDELKDNATFDKLTSPSGIKYVLVNGSIALKDGEITTKREFI